MKYLILAIFVFSFTSVASADFPDFPMAFWGDVTINGGAAPAGSVVRVYDSTNTLVGEVSLIESGVYGYTEPTKQKLVVGESVGPLQFSIKSSQVNGGVETRGSSQVTHSEFISGETFKKDLAFTTTVPSASAGSGGGGGGGGGKRVIKNEVVTAPLLSLSISTSSASSTTDNIELQKQIITLLIKLIELLKMRL